MKRVLPFMKRAGYFIIEARWEDFSDPDFHEVDILCGTIDEAQGVAQNYLNKHVSMHEPALTWLEGVPNKQGKVWYANNPHVTLRIRQ